MKVHEALEILSQADSESQLRLGSVGGGEVEIIITKPGPSGVVVICGPDRARQIRESTGKLKGDEDNE